MVVVFWDFCILFYLYFVPLYFVSFVFCYICILAICILFFFILSFFHFGIFVFCHVVLCFVWLYFVLFVSWNICILSRIRLITSFPMTYNTPNKMLKASFPDIVCPAELNKTDRSFKRFCICYSRK